jgi:hypothetical protein
MDLWVVMLAALVLVGKFDGYGWLKWLIPFVPYGIELVFVLLGAVAAGFYAGMQEVHKENNRKRRIAAHKEQRK